jgi:secondary thiamine-phosphate synthase enzyme
MKSLTKYLWFNTRKRHEFVNITKQVEDVVKESGIKEGLVLVNAMHITASVYINDAESGLINDFQAWLSKLAPTDGEYRHNLTGEDNGYAHLWRTVMGRDVVVAITNGTLDFGPWEQIYYAEFDGQRKKRVLVKVLGE